MSEALQDRISNHEKTESGSNSQPANQPVLALKDSGTSAFPSFQSGDQPSPSKSDCSEDESTQTSSFQPSNSAIIPPAFHEMRVAGVANPPGSSPNNLSGLVSNVYRTTGREPPGLVGASTTIVGDKLYVFGGRRLRPQRLTRALYVLDLISRHWTKLESSGDVPTPRFFHTLCALGDTKLVCYGGMALAPQTAESSQRGSQADVTMTVTSDIHVYDIATRIWKAINTAESPPRRYAHCATILPSSAVFSSSSAPLSALRHNPSSDVPNQGTIGVSIDGRGGAEMIVVGGQDGQSHFIDSIEVFNFRSLKWSTSVDLSKSYGAYRSVIAPLIGLSASRVGKPRPETPQTRDGGEGATAEYEEDSGKEHVSGSPMLIFSNYNFLNTRVEVQVRLPDGTLTEKVARGKLKPPGLRFPNGGVIDKHLIVSGTYITSSQQEYMIWALDLHNLVWNRIDAGGGGFNTGSWNRGVLWSKQNTYVILGHRHRKLNEDYNTRRLNFSNICTVELEAFGLYTNPKRDLPLGLQRFSSPLPGPSSGDLDRQSQDLVISQPVESLGSAAMSSIELCDMELLARDGERIPVNSHVLRTRWGAYFQQLLREDLTRAHPGSEPSPVRLNISIDSTRNRSSIMTFTPSISTTISNGTTAIDTDASSQRRPSTMSNSTAASNSSATSNSTAVQDSKDFATQAQPSRSRLLYLPHTYLTIRALVHYLYTTSLPPLTSPFCTPQILCSLLQIARPYRVDGLLEATVERLHQVLDNRNTAAIFNAAAMAAGGGDAIRFVSDLTHIDALTLKGASSTESSGNATVVRPGAMSQQTLIEDDSEDAISSASASTTSISDIEEESRDMVPDIWKGEISAVVGLQKRGLRGLMEGRRLRGPGKADDLGGSSGGAAVNEGGQNISSPVTSMERPGASSVGLGIG